MLRNTAHYVMLGPFTSIDSISPLVSSDRGEAGDLDSSLRWNDTKKLELQKRRLEDIKQGPNDNNKG
jgi:hypothetical protein